jgi:hypothetical protein
LPGHPTLFRRLEKEFKKARLLESEVTGVKAVPIDSLMTKIVERVQKSSSLFRGQ